MGLGRTAAAAALAASLLFAACGAKAGDPSPLPTRATLLPSGLGTQMTTGTVHFELSGGVEGSYDIPLITPSVYNPPPGGASLSFADTEKNSAGIGGVFKSGKTSDALVITMTVSQPSITLFISQKGECTIDFGAAGEGGVAGSFECTGLSGAEGGPTDAIGSFEATP